MLVDFLHGSIGQLLLQQMPEETVFHAAAAEKDPMGIGGKKSAQRGSDAAGYEMGGRAQQIVEAGVAELGLFHHLVHEFFAKSVGRQTARGPPLQGRMGKPALHQSFQAPALDSVFAAGIKWLLAARESPHQIIQENVARRRLKTNHVAKLAPGG